MIFYGTNWYWYVGGGGSHADSNGDITTDKTRAFSSAQNQYVPAADPTFQAWISDLKSHFPADDPRAAPDYDPTTNIDTEANLADVLNGYGINNPNFN